MQTHAGHFREMKQWLQKNVMSKLFVVVCLFLNIGNTRACFYTSENDSLETERTMMKKEGTEKEQSPWEGKREWLLELSGRTGPWS